jgi:hypothetical protein
VLFAMLETRSECSVAVVGDRGGSGEEYEGVD